MEDRIAGIFVTLITIFVIVTAFVVLRLDNDIQGLTKINSKQVKRIEGLEANLGFSEGIVCGEIGIIRTEIDHVIQIQKDIADSIMIIHPDIIIKR